MKKDPPWMVSPPTTFKDKIALLERKKSYLRSPSPRGAFLRQLLRDVQQEARDAKEKAIEQCPIAFFKPSYEQALLLNAWMWGIAFLCVYSGNRIGKTTACIINIILWIFPNDPTYRVFKPYTDHKGRLVQVFPRPPIEALKLIADALKRRPLDLPAPNPLKPHYDKDNARILQWLQSQVPQAFRPSFPFSPWNKGGTIWFGGPDQEHHEKILFPLWKQYTPAASRLRFSPSDREATFEIVTPPTPTAPSKKTIWELIGKSYESKDTKWSSGAVDIIALTEGVKPATFKEIKLRFKDPGVGSHDFTPYEPANQGAAAALAYRIFKGSEPLPLRHHVFTEFSVYDAPEHIISEDKRQGLIDSFKNDPEGKARLEGKFYSSSALVLSNFSRDIHLLDWTEEEMFQRFPTAQIYRGLDPGYDHPTACAWGLLLPTNQWIIYRIMAERGLSIGQRCERIAQLSHNKIEKVYWGPHPTNFYAVETHPFPNSEIVMATPTDFHTFKRDEVTGMPYALNYNTSGLTIVESVHMSPEDRATLLNDQLRPDQFTPNLITHKPPGPKVMFLKQGYGVMEAVLKWEEFYWDRKKGGENKGQPNDKVPEHGDDELDAVCYITCGPYKWTRYRPPARFVNDAEPEFAMIQASQSLSTRSNASTGNFATIAKDRPKPEVVIFGDPNLGAYDRD